MTVYKQPSSPYWLIEVQIDGRRYRCSSKTTSKRDARRLEQRWRDELTARKDWPALSLGEALDRYRDLVLVPRNRPRAAERERYLHDRIRHDLGADTPMRLITAAAIASFSEALLRQGKARPP